MISYGPTYLSEPGGSEVSAWIEDSIAPADLFPLAQRTSWPGALSGGPVLDRTRWPRRKVRIGSLYWPWGASRWAEAHYVCSEAQLANIRQYAYTGPNGYQALPLVVDDATNRVRANMWVLPARPLATAVAGAGMFLLSLVDDRYFWWERQLSLGVTPGTTAWTDLYAAVGVTLGVAIAVDPIPAAYLTPPADYATATVPLPLVLDAIAFSVGQRVTRSYAGVVSAQNYATAAANSGAQALAWTKYAGGQFQLDARR